LQADGDVPAAKRPKKKGVAAGVGAGVGGGTGGEAPAKVAVPRALAKCGVCRRRKSECKGGPAARPDKRFAKPDVPKANLKVGAGSVLMLYDIETSVAVAGGETLLNEVGACTAIYVGGNWMLGAEEYKGVTKEKLAQWTRVNCKGLAVEAAGSQKEFPQVWEELKTYVEKMGVKYLVAHGMVATDLRVTVDEGWRFGVDVLKELMALGVEGVVDTCRMIPEQGVKALMHDGKEKVLGNGALYKKATKGQTMGKMGLVEHRALDDTKAARFWLTALPEMTEVLFGAPRRHTAMSLAALRDYYAKNRARREYLKSAGRT